MIFIARLLILPLRVLIASIDVLVGFTYTGFGWQEEIVNKQLWRWALTGKPSQPADRD